MTLRIRRFSAREGTVPKTVPTIGGASCQESVAQSFFKRMPIQSLIETTRLDRPARLADGLELERAPVRLCKSTPAALRQPGYFAGSKPAPQRSLVIEIPRLDPPLPRGARDSATSSAIVCRKKNCRLARSQPRAINPPHDTAKTCDVVRLKPAANWTVGLQDGKGDSAVGHLSFGHTGKIESIKSRSREKTGRARVPLQAAIARGADRRVGAGLIKTWSGRQIVFFRDLLRTGSGGRRLHQPKSFLTITRLPDGPDGIASTA